MQPWTLINVIFNDQLFFANCWFTFAPRFVLVLRHLAMYPNYTPDLLFGAIGYENIADSREFEYCRIEVVTDCLFQVIISPISMDIHKGGIQDYITMSHPSSCKYKIINLIYNTAKIWTELLYRRVMYHWCMSLPVKCLEIVNDWNNIWNIAKMHLNIDIQRGHLG